VIASCLPGEITRRADCAFCELHPPGGDATMLRPETRERIKADAWFSPEHGESRLAYAVRVRRSLLATVREFPGSTAAVVTHAGYIRRASAFAGGAAFADAPRPANASVTRLVVIRLADAGLRWQVAQYAEEVAADVTTGRG
jgi:broad specificity phosphatase PhoE